jgi:hypothetical protein
MKDSGMLDQLPPETVVDMLKGVTNMFESMPEGLMDDQDKEMLLNAAHDA